jgi:hypothetical protein
MPTPFYLKKWIADFGWKQAEAYVRERQFYGTLFHILASEILVERRPFSLDAISDRIEDWFRQTGSRYDVRKWAEELKADVVALAVWATDYKVRPLAVEMVLASDALGIAGAIDLVCELEIEEAGFFGEYYKTGARAGEPKETKRSKTIRAIVDYKTGKHDFYDENALQANMYRLLWNENFPESPVDACFNFAPKDWEKLSDDKRSRPYRFKDQTDEYAIAEIAPMVTLWKLRERHKPNDIREISGEIILSDAGVSGFTVERVAIEKAVVDKWTTGSGAVELVAQVESESEAVETFFDNIS